MSICDSLICTGCLACASCCPVGAINHTEDNEGFKIPEIDESRCINCRLCGTICPANSTVAINFPCAQVGLRYILNDRELFESASGGASLALCKYVIKQGGVIFGATLNEDNKCIHIAVTNIDDLPRLQGSKYVQSDMADTYSLAKECLLNDRIVLFTGTPCQIAGLYTAVGKNKFDNLYTVDLICHGVPSPMLFKQYIDYLEKQNKGKIIHINFRSKARHGWGVAGYYTKTKTKTNYISQYKNPYMIAFLKNLSLRECCYSCKYARPERVSDITIGDLWGVEEIAPSFADKRGCSVALVNTDKGDEMISWIKDSCDIIDLNLSDVVKHQSMLQRPVERPKERDTFYEVIRQGGIERWWREYNTPVRYIKNAAKYYAGLYVPKPALALVKKSIRKILK